MKMLLLLLLVFNAFCLNTNHLTHGNIIQKHQAKNQCCTSSGGFLCGKTIKTCCKSGCESFWYGIYCKNSLQYNPICSDSCINKCRTNGGVPCAVIVDTGKITCCPSQDCHQPQYGGMTETLISNGVTIAMLLLHEQVAQKQSLKDKLIQKVIGKNNICLPNTVIDIGKCMIDKNTDLLKARIFG